MFLIVTDGGCFLSSKCDPSINHTIDNPEIKQVSLVALTETQLTLI